MVRRHDRAGAAYATEGVQLVSVSGVEWGFISAIEKNEVRGADTKVLEAKTNYVKFNKLLAKAMRRRVDGSSAVHLRDALPDRRRSLELLRVLRKERVASPARLSEPGAAS